MITSVVAGCLGLSMATTAFAEEITLNMAVPDWPPTRIMKKLFDENYKAKSGNTVKLEVDFIPWPDYYTRLNASLTSGEQKYNMAVSDSQWLGAFIEGGYYRKLNDLVDPELKAILDDMHQAPLQAYGTYPYKSDNLYGFPQMPDILITYARTDVLCHADEQAAFKAKYGTKLPCTPEELDGMDWDMFGNIGEFFQRKKGEKLAGAAAADDFYGIAYQAGKGYDFSSMQINGFLWQHGAEIWDETNIPKAQAEGVVNSDTAVKGFDHYLSLLKYMPPVVKTGSMDIFKTDELFREGKIALNIEWIGFAESAINPETSKVAGKIAFASMPGLKMADGSINRTSNIGGQPFVIMTWTDDKKIKEAVDFVKWWLSPEIQHQFASAGGQSAIKSVYNDPKYTTYRPWNRTWASGLDWQQDVWHIPQFFEMLVQQQEQFDLAITGKQDAKATLDNIAKFQQRLLSDEGLIE
ncbi:MAG: carbohydrate ABC transporter substrate-binding protein [Hyphomicrobiales bacterium]|nr:carbohydrate ABC transporter substrate-binding protein [Hyphomicrobiales bacterium]